MKKQGELKMVRFTLENRSTPSITTGARSGVLAALPLTLLLALISISVPTMSSADEEMDSKAGPPGTIEFVGKNLIMKANGTFHDWRVVESEVDLGALADAYVVVEVDLASVDTGIEGRDDHLRNPDFFETETYPVARVRIHSAKPAPAGEEDEGDDRQRFAVDFDIDLHGVQKTIEGEIMVLTTDPLVFEGNVLIDRMEFGVGPKWNWWSPVTPREKIPVKFRVEL
jgi:polyisoprenoid-binding protein YceI